MEIGNNTHQMFALYVEMNIENKMNLDEYVSFEQLRSQNQSLSAATFEWCDIVMLCLDELPENWSLIQVWTIF